MHEYELHLSWLEEQRQDLERASGDFIIYDELPKDSINRKKEERGEI